ncbi:MAG TPA: biotin synthase BioB [Chroococcales cyanobacterium]
MEKTISTFAESTEACQALDTVPVRNDWTKEEVTSLYHTALLDLVYRAATVHRLYHNHRAVQQCTLLSIKTGACPEDCAYCPQSAHYKTEVKAEGLLNLDTVVTAARIAADAGSTRFCMGAAWRQVKDNEEFDRVLEMVRQVGATGMEVCCTLGMLTREQAQKLKDAGLTAYNHNLDSGESFYEEIITTRTYQDRLETIKNVREAGISVCCGGIIGMGETHEDRIDLLHTLSTLPEHPESVPVNALVSVDGTPLADAKPVPGLDLVRMIAAARILMPRAMVRLSAGRVSLSLAEQAFCFMAGANSIFTGDKLLTTPNSDFNEDRDMLESLGLEGLKPAAASASVSAHAAAECKRC